MVVHGLALPPLLSKEVQKHTWKTEWTGGEYVQTEEGDSVTHPCSTASKLKVMDSALPCQASLRDSRKFLNMLENGHWRFVPSARNERYGGNVLDLC